MLAIPAVCLYLRCENQKENGMRISAVNNLRQLDFRSAFQAICAVNPSVSKDEG